MTEPAQRGTVAYGWDRLLCEILAAALSHHGWRVLSSELRPAEPHDSDRIILLYCSNPNSTKAIKDVQRAHTKYCRANIVLLSGEINDSQLLRFIRAGVTGYVRTHQGLPELLEAMQLAWDNRTPSNGHVTRLVLHNIRALTRKHRLPAQSQLTQREKQVLALIRKGLSNKQIAGYLSIAPNTVKNHVHNLLEKLNVRSRHEAGCEKLCLQGYQPTAKTIIETAAG